MVTLGKENRLFGADSLMDSGKYPLSTFGEVLRTFGQKFDSDEIQKLKEHRMVTNEFVANERGLAAWKVEDEVLESEEITAMLFQYVKMLAEKQAEATVRESVITIPSWFTYDQRLMIRDSAEALAGLSVLQLVHENVAAAVLFGVDKIDKEAQNHTVLFYNMGGMDTEVTIVKYSHLNVSEKAKKLTPYIEVLAETSERELGSKDFELVLFNILADKFNALKEREGKPDVRTNVRAAKRLQKEVIKIKEVLSANKQASVKVPELLDYVTLQLILERSEMEERAAHIFDKVTKPIERALELAGLTMDDINQVELLGGGIRTPKVTEILEKAVNGKELGVHLNGDEAMCFGSAFIGSNNTMSFKVASVMLTQKPDYQVRMVIEPMDPADALSEEDQRAEGAEDEDIIRYSQDIRLFNDTDYMGKSKGLTMVYNKNMRVKFYRAPLGSEVPLEEQELLDTFELDDLKDQYESAVKHQEAQAEKAKKREEKKKNETEGNSTSSSDSGKDESEGEAASDKAEKPKLKLSVLLSRSGYIQIKAATVGTMHLNVDSVRKPAQLTKDGIAAAKKRLKKHQKRDEDKIKTDIARNDFESMIYKMRSWLREDENAVYVEAETLEERIDNLTALEDWLYEDGASANYSVYEDKYKELAKEFGKFETRKGWYEQQDEFKNNTLTALDLYLDKVAKLSETKPWITNEELKDVIDKVDEIRKWFEGLLEKQESAPKHQDPLVKAADVLTKLEKLKKLYTKVSKKKKPKPPKEEKPKEEEEKEDFNDGESDDSSNNDTKKEEKNTTQSE